MLATCSHSKVIRYRTFPSPSNVRPMTPVEFQPGSILQKNKRNTRMKSYSSAFCAAVALTLAFSASSPSIAAPLPVLKGQTVSTDIVNVEARDIPQIEHHHPSIGRGQRTTGDFFNNAKIGVAHENWCFDRYRSYRSADNSFQPYGGGSRRSCSSPHG